MNPIIENIKKKYITKKIVGDFRPKMKRNLQPEIEKIKSIQKSIHELGYISDSEKFRLLSEIEKLENILN